MTQQQEVAALKARVGELKQVLTIFMEALENIDGSGSVMLTPELRNYLVTARGLLLAPKLRHLVRRGGQ